MRICYTLGNGGIKKTQQAALLIRGIQLLDEELRRLQKENANLKEDWEILKKASAIFSKHPK